MKLIDVHAHLQFSQFDSDREAVIKRAREAGVAMINVGTDLETSRGAVKLAEENNGMWATVGIHPTDLPEDSELERTFIELEKLAKHPKVVGIGECGLDFKSEKLKIACPTARRESYKVQTQVFEKQIELAQQVEKPLMLHIRNAYAEVLDILTFNFKLSTSRPGNVHFFAGDWPTAQRFLDLGFTLSFTGVITFANQYDEVLRNVPLDRIMLETDCPFVAPVPYRGKRNEPSYLTAVAERLATIRGLPMEEIARVTSFNAKQLFGLALSQSSC